MSINTYIRPSFLRKIHACSPYDPVAASTTVIPTTVSNSRVTPSNHKYGWLYHIVGYTSPDIWVNYNISPTWIKAIWGWFPILTMISSEVAVRSLWFTHILYIYIYISYITWRNHPKMGIELARFPGHVDDPLSSFVLRWPWFIAMIYNGI